MDLATLVGIGMAFAGIFGAQVLEGGNPASIILPAPLMLVLFGTLLGLVHVLSQLWAPTKLGGLIASAFVAPLWGVMLANVVFLPLGNRLKRLSTIECEQMELAIEGILAIQAGSNPRLVAQKLKSLLPPGEADKKAKAA